MCGIAGVFLSGADRADSEALRALEPMVDAIVRRGPDDEGVWFAQRCGLGFRRLSVLDLSSAGHQPMQTADGRYTLVYNGEIYNFQSLRQSLCHRGVRFKSSGDSEVVLQALATWGLAALERFNGMFALGLYDRDENRLLLARDHIGIKPLWYLHTSNGVAFGSQFNQLLRHPWGQAQSISQAALGLYFRFGFIPAPYGLLERSFQVEPGGYAEICADGRLTLGKYWSFPDESRSRVPGQAAEDALETALANAVRRHLVSDVPVGVFLSGGIDSPLVAAEAKKHHSERLRAFSVSVPGSPLDEADDARRYADELGLDLHAASASPRTALDLLDEVASACTEPLGDVSIFPCLQVSALARQHVTVALSGDGGDELFWGYPQRQVATLEQSHYYRYPRWVRYGHVAARKTLGIGNANRDALWESVGRLYQKKHSMAPASDVTALFPELPQLPLDLNLFCFNSVHPDEIGSWMRRVDLQIHLQRILLKVDRASMHHSLEVRVPLLDREVMEVAARVRWQDCLDTDTRVGKMPLRRALSRRVKHQTVPKKGFTVPIHEWLRGPLNETFQNEVAGRKEVLGLPIDQPAMRDLQRRLQQGDETAGRSLWMLLSLALWKRRHLDASVQ